MSFQYELEQAKVAARRAQEVILRHYQTTQIAVSHKSPGQPLTQADTDANDVIASVLRQSFPDDGWLSEESPDDLSRLKKKRVWVVDPLDGTQDFIDKNPEFTVSIGLVENGKPVVGVICNPVTGDLFYGARGLGVFCNAAEISVTKNNNLDSVALLVSKAESRRGDWERFKNDFSMTPTGGSAFKLALVAAGRADGCFTLRAKSEWDICAGHVLIAEAGGVITDADGAELVYNKEISKFRTIVYSNPFVHKYILEKICRKPNSPVSSTS